MDNAFPTAPFPGMSDMEMIKAIEKGSPNAAKMAAEIERRAKADAGDVSVMTPGERLRWVKAGN